MDNVSQQTVARTYGRTFASQEKSALYVAADELMERIRQGKLTGNFYIRITANQGGITSARSYQEITT